MSGRALTIGFLLCIAGFTTFSFDMGERARLVPQIVLLLTLCLLAAQVAIDLLPEAKRLDLALRLRVSSVTIDKTVKREQKQPAIWIDLAWFAAVPITMYVLGLVLGGAGYVFAYLVRRAGLAYPKALVYTAITMALLLLVGKMFSVPMTFPGGVPNIIAIPA